MKWNWGTKLVVAMAVFMGFIIVLVIQTTKNDVNLVEKDYYPKGLKYQDRLDQIDNAAPYYNTIQIFQDAENIVIQLPQINPDTGTIYFFRPSNTELDKIYEFNPTDTYSQSFSKSAFQKGKYLVKIYWMENDKAYYIEKPFYFN